MSLATRTSVKPLTLSSSIVLRKLCLAAKASPEQRVKSPEITDTHTVKPLPVQHHLLLKICNLNDKIIIYNILNPIIA